MRIGLLDTGIDGLHPALAGRVERFRYFAPSGFRGAADAATEAVSHGTATAGLLAGGVCDGRMIGVAPGARLQCGAVLEAGNIVARTLLGLDWLADSGVSVVTLPFGLRGETPVLRSMIRAMARKDILVVCPIGNGGAGAGCAPGSYEEVLSVGACGADGRVARFSGSLNDARTRECHRPDVVARGVDVLSLAPGGGTILVSGTSVSCAIVAGLASLLRQAFPAESAAAVKRALIRSAVALKDDQAHRARQGMVRALEAFAALDRGMDPDGGEMPDTPVLAGKFIEPRLADQLARCRGDDLSDAVLEFSSAPEAAKAARQLRAQGGGRGQLRLLKHAAVIILRERAAAIRALVDSPSTVIASACDISRSLL